MRRGLKLSVVEVVGAAQAAVVTAEGAAGMAVEAVGVGDTAVPAGAAEIVETAEIAGNRPSRKKRRL